MWACPSQRNELNNRSLVLCNRSIGEAERGTGKSKKSKKTVPTEDEKERRGITITEKEGPEISTQQWKSLSWHLHAFPFSLQSLKPNICGFTLFAGSIFHASCRHPYCFLSVGAYWLRQVLSLASVLQREKTILLPMKLKISILLPPHLGTVGRSTYSFIRS